MTKESVVKRILFTAISLVMALVFFFLYRGDIAVPSSYGFPVVAIGMGILVISGHFLLRQK